MARWIISDEMDDEFSIHPLSMGYKEFLEKRKEFSMAIKNCCDNCAKNPLEECEGEGIFNGVCKDFAPRRKGMNEAESKKARELLTIDNARLIAERDEINKRRCECVEKLEALREKYQALEQQTSVTEFNALRDDRDMFKQQAQIYQRKYNKLDDNVDKLLDDWKHKYKHERQLKTTAENHRVACEKEVHLQSETIQLLHRQHNEAVNEVEQYKRSTEENLKAENEMSQAYLRLRMILGVANDNEDVSQWSDREICTNAEEVARYFVKQAKKFEDLTHPPVEADIDFDPAILRTIEAIGKILTGEAKGK